MADNVDKWLQQLKAAEKTSIVQDGRNSFNLNELASLIGLSRIWSIKLNQKANERFTTLFPIEPS